LRLSDLGVKNYSAITLGAESGASRGKRESFQLRNEDPSRSEPQRAPATLRKRPAGDRVQGVTERRSHFVWHNISNLTVGIRCIQETINHPLVGQNDYPCNQARFCAVPDSGSGPRHLRMISHRPSKGQALVLDPCQGVAGPKKRPPPPLGKAVTIRERNDPRDIISTGIAYRRLC
jgi:hypothetical protein